MGAALAVQPEPGLVVLAFSGRLDATGTGSIWRATLREAARRRDARLAADLSEVAFLDTTGATLLLACEAAHGGGLDVRGASPSATALLARLRQIPPQSPPASPPAWRLLAALTGVRDRGIGSLAFLGEAALAVIHLPRRHRMLRWPDLLRTADEAGVQAVPLVLMLGFLIGLILAFQSVVPLRRYGADIYVASLVALSLLRELGPLLTGVILAGRTGSAFAAELGTMKVNEELSAIDSMGLNAMTLLVLPRLISAMLVMPALTLLLDLAGLLGMTVVMKSFGYPVAAVANQVQQWVTLNDLFTGLFKALIFGAAIAAIGCRAGLRAGYGPRAVGEAATGAVVGSIVAMIVLDGLFAVMFFIVGL